MPSPGTTARATLPSTGAAVVTGSVLVTAWLEVTGEDVSCRQDAGRRHLAGQSLWSRGPIATGRWDGGAVDGRGRASPGPSPDTCHTSSSRLSGNGLLVS